MATEFGSTAHGAPSTGGPRRVLVVSNHLIAGQRRTSIHFITRTLRDLGWSVAFLTVGLSQMSRLRGDRRLRDRASHPRNTWSEVEQGIRSFVWFAPFHPVNLRRSWANRLAMPLFSRYSRFLPRRALAVAAKADLIIIEGGAGITLVPALRRANSHAPFIYRVSDTLEALKPHPAIVEAEHMALPHLDLVSCASPLMLPLFSAARRVRHHPHGIDLSAYGSSLPSPYEADEIAVLSIGDMKFDADAALSACRALPHVRFHFFGHGQNWPDTPNAVVHGERPFRELMPYLQHARAGIAFYRPSPEAAYLADTSNKLMHFAANRLPIVAPSFVARAAPNFFAYDNAPGSVAEAVLRALSCDRSAWTAPDFPAWVDVTRRILADAEVA